MSAGSWVWQAFFVKQKTAYEMRISDWSSDVCSSDLGRRGGDTYALWVIDPIDGTANFVRGLPWWRVAIALVVHDRLELGLIYEPIEIGRASCGVRVCQYV